MLLLTLARSAALFGAITTLKVARRAAVTAAGYMLTGLLLTVSLGFLTLSGYEAIRCSDCKWRRLLYSTTKGRVQNMAFPHRSIHAHVRRNNKKFTPGHPRLRRASQRIACLVVDRNDLRTISDY
jgi:hypothetical protein